MQTTGPASSVEHYVPRELSTARLVLEPLTPWYADVLQASASDPTLYTYLADEPPARRPTGAKAVARRYGEDTESDSNPPLLWLKWAIRLQGGGYVGIAEIRASEADIADIAWLVFTAHQGCGYGREFVAAVVAHVTSDIGITIVRATIDARNKASIRVAEAAGFVPVGERRGMRRGMKLDELVYETGAPNASG